MTIHSNSNTRILYTILRFAIVGLFGASIALSAEVVAAEDPRENDEKPRLLMVSQSKGWVHQSVKRMDQHLSAAELAMKKLALSTQRFDIDFSQDVAAHLTRENLQNYDIVMFYTSGDLPIASDDLKYLLDEWVRQPNHGFIGVHSASDTLKEHEPYWDFVGGTFNGHPWDKNTKVTLTVHDTDHPTMKPFVTQDFQDNAYEITEEIYQYEHWQPEKVRVLMSIDMAKTKLKRPYHVPVAWVKEIGEGKMYYNNLGHREDTWENAEFLGSIDAAIAWIQGEEKGDATPNPEVSEQQHQHSIEAAAAVGITPESLEAERREQALKDALREQKKSPQEDK